MCKRGKISMTNQHIILKPEIVQMFQKCMESGRIFFISAPCGFGKTSIAEALVTGYKIRRLFPENPDITEVKEDSGWDVLMVDDLQLMQEEDQKELCNLIREKSDKHFVLISRGLPPGELLAFQYVGLMTVIQADTLLFDRNDIRALFSAHEIPVTDSEVSGILKESMGYPLGVAITVKYMADRTRFSPEVVAKSFREVFWYFDTAIYRRFDLPIRRFLLELAPFEEFDTEMARMVSGEPQAALLLEWLQKNTTMIRYDRKSVFYFWPQFREFLLWEMDREYTPEKKRTLYGRGGMYYELKEDYSHALECYTKSEDHSKVSDLLIRGSKMHPGMGHYSEIEKYYRSLPESEIKASPSLMQGMSMLCALSADYEKSEYWYDELKRFADACNKRDAAGRQARSRLAWLDISLPQRGVENLTETIPAVFRLMMNKEIKLPAFSVTSALPSLMNGGKDFSEWSKKDDFLYQTLRIPVEAVLGKDGTCLADCAIAESKFEKGEDISRKLLNLVSHIGDIQRNGTPDIEFAVTGLLARNQIANGQAEDALRTIESLRARFEEQGETRFLENIDALICRIYLHIGALDEVDAWYREKAPRDPLHVNVMKRYQYTTEAMAELVAGKPDEALLTLAPLEPYYETCKRQVDSIHLKILQTIAYYRKREECWKEILTEALDLAAEYHFIRTISDYGAALRPLLEILQYAGGEKSWREKLMADVREQAACYPMFLEPRLSMKEELTATELQILRLICADKSNAQIGEIMNIKLTTVKTHVSHILDKLGVSRRNEAKTMAKKLWLI